MSPELRLASALLVACLYGLFCLWTAWRYRRRQRAALSGNGNGSGNGSGAGLLVAWASQSGSAEDLAARTARSLRAAGRDVRLLPLEAVEAETLRQTACALFVVSTTGEGDAPTHAFRFVSKVMAAPADFPHLRYGVLALGDRSYAQFCAFGRRLDAWLAAGGATPLFARIDVDNGAEDALALWRQELARLGAAVTRDITDGPAFTPWVLTGRRLLNPGSVGGPVYLLRLDATTGGAVWEAGDIAEIELPGPPEAATGHRPHRSYSIASLPEDGAVELLVRQVRHPDGRLGAGSGWLTETAPVGSEIRLRLRRNSSFHPQAEPRPLILVGNGTGLAGLRAHLKRQAARGCHRNWLIFGERNRAHDFHLRDEIEAWQAQGVLERVTLAFSRDLDTRVYVQHRLLEQGEAVRRWVEDGAAIHVCGSAEGMAGAVREAFTRILGAERVNRLIEQGLYRQDVY